MLAEAVASGRGLEVFAGVVADQGGDPAVLEDPSRLVRAPHRHVVEAPASGVVTSCHARTIGVAGVRLGAGRAAKEDDVDPSVGITIHRVRGF